MAIQLRNSGTIRAWAFIAPATDKRLRLLALVLGMDLGKLNAQALETFLRDHWDEHEAAIAAYNTEQQKAGQPSG